MKKTNAVNSHQREKQLQKRAIRIIDTLAKAQRRTMLGEFQDRKMNAFQMLIATILSARAKDETTMPISQNLFKKYPTPQKLAKAKPEDVKKIIRQIGFFNNKTKHIIACSQMLVDPYQGKVPDTLEELLKLPGVGKKVANCVLVYAFNKDAIPVDTHVHRIAHRLGICSTTNPEKTGECLEKIFPKKYWQLINDSLVHHGKTVCKPITPECSKCSVVKLCNKVDVFKTK